MLYLNIWFSKKSGSRTSGPSLVKQSENIKGRFNIFYICKFLKKIGLHFGTSKPWIINSNNGKKLNNAVVLFFGAIVELSNVDIVRLPIDYARD
jgi:hypothetical protein